MLLPHLKHLQGHVVEEIGVEDAIETLRGNIYKPSKRGLSVLNLFLSRFSLTYRGCRKKLGHL